MEERWTTVCRKLTLLGYLAFFILGETVSKEEPKRISLYRRHFDCIPVLYHHGYKINSTLLPGGSHLEHVTLKFHAFGRPFAVDLSLNKHLFSTSYVEKIVHSQGESVKTGRISGLPGNCFYHGRLRHLPESEVAISTCNGFTGYITDRHDTYHLEPWKGQVHRVYRDKDQRKLPFKCGTDGHDSRLHSHREILHRHKRTIRAPYDSNKNTRFVELYLVNDLRTFERHGKNKEVIIQRSQDIANIVSSLYRQLNIYVALVGVEVWTAGDLIKITSSADNTMENFLRYRKERINPVHHNDNAQLITGVYFDHGVVGKAIKGPICTHQFSGGVNMDYGGVVTHVATTVAHEMGHNFGMQHDNDTTCECRDDKCIMAATSGQISPQHWSSCSQSALAEAFDLGMDYCLRNIPTFIYNSPICGNGFKEDGEECDCGLPKDCTNRCCNPYKCELHPLAECGTGRCCDLNTCKPKEASIMCREPIGECDLAEFCNGTSQYCPRDVHIYDGMSCKNGQSYCYNGDCKTHTGQCKLLWGNSGRVSDPVCFQQLNMNAKGDGSCGYDWTTQRYQRCDKEDVMCGLLHCIHLNEKLMFWRDNLAMDMGVSFLTRGNRHYVCRSARLDVGLDMHDPGFVPDGAKCEENKICINQKCTALAKLNVKKCPENCNNHGKCNSNGNCHCNVGYAPPLCDRPGYGGSLDSGPASNEYVEDADKDLLIALLVVFLLVLPFIILIILAYINRQRLCKWWKNMPTFKDRFKNNPYARRPPRPTLTPSASQPRRDPPPPSQSDHMAKPFTNIAAHQNPRIWTPNSAGNKPPGRPATGPKTSGIKVNSPKTTSQKPLLSVPIQETEGPPSTGGKNKKSTQVTTSVENHAPSAKGSLDTNVPNSPKSNKVMKRDSFRGAEISYPVLRSTTNRNSLVEDMLAHVDIIGPEASKPVGSPSGRPRSAAMRRSNSDRMAPHQEPTRPTSPFDNKNNTPKNSASTKSPLRANLERIDSRPNSTHHARDEWDDDDEHIYCNEQDQDDLVSSINKTLDERGIYHNISNEIHLNKPVQETDPPVVPARASRVNKNNLHQASANTPKQSDDKTPTALPQSNNKKTSDGLDLDKVPSKFTKPSPPVKSSNVEVKTPPKRNTPGLRQLSSQTSNNVQDKSQGNQPKTPNAPVSKPKPTNSFSSVASRTDSGLKEAPKFPQKPATKASSVSSPVANSKTNSKLSGPKSPSDSPIVAKNATRTPNPNTNVSNLAAKFNQNSDQTSVPRKETNDEKDRHIIKRSDTVTGTKPTVAEKPSPGAKPKPALAPKPVEQEKKPVLPKPASTEVKRVRSFKI